MKDYIVNLGVNVNRIYIFSMNSIERDIEYINRARRNSIRDKYHLPQDAKVILTVARLEPEKNYVELLDLFAGLPDNYYLFSLGRGGLLQSLKEQCKNLNIENRVFFEGFVDRLQCCLHTLKIISIIRSLSIFFEFSLNMLNIWF
jgi:glycosyltransferase involved in cell wall biosynthesis